MRLVVLRSGDHFTSRKIWIWESNNILCAQCERRRFYMIYRIFRNRANFNENPSMRAIAKILQARASEHSSKFCEQIEQRPNFASSWKFLWPFDTPRTVLRKAEWNFSNCSDEKKREHFSENFRSQSVLKYGICSLFPLKNFSNRGFRGMVVDWR